ncbi:putative negative regulator of DNA transposition [Emericellopsis atlantica]|uniref:Negative regulator of DNA transposition n=1 Tax=Emericellopsis atlantica TaxID=2614577 RepID=A0A9P7ZR03_9HYPO|nr:putative negative regulator of DNA transposition [Emericellopsis atlantica]KAG9256511.1 putative negative regulator of DNA transposition [Emericellopsis atlantica]
MNSTNLDAERLKRVFGPRQDIIDGIGRAADSPGRIALFNEIAAHVNDHYAQNEGPAQKKRKVDSNGTTSGVKTEGNAGAPANEDLLLVVKEISVSVPQRKKFEICFTQNWLYARAPGSTDPLPNICYQLSEIEYAFYLPVPEKTQVQHNFVLFPRETSVPGKEGNEKEPLVFTVPATAPKEGTIGGQEAAQASSVSDTYKGLFFWALNRRFASAGNSVQITSSDPNKFHSVIKQPHRPSERAVHISAYRGSKDGYLFFLENGIFWGFKKPLIFIPLNRIFAISYTSILQMTFNIVVEVLTGDGDETQEFEFGMIDQQDYGGLADYIAKNRLQDRSMADQRKAKLQLAENRNGKKGANGEDPAAPADQAEDAAGGDGMTELQRAQLEAEQLAQDEEDEDEEDYDPGSEGESEGSGSSSEEDDDDENAQGNDDDGEDVDEVSAEEEGGQEEEAPDTKGTMPLRSGRSALKK